MESQQPVQVRLSPTTIHAEIDQRIHYAQQTPLNPLIEGEYFIWMSLMVLFAEHLTPVEELKDRDTPHPLPHYEKVIQNTSREQICQTLRTIMGTCAKQEAQAKGLSEEAAEASLQGAIDQIAGFVTPDALLIRVRYIFRCYQQHASETISMLNALNALLDESDPARIRENPDRN